MVMSEKMVEACERCAEVGTVGAASARYLLMDTDRVELEVSTDPADDPDPDVDPWVPAPWVPAGNYLLDYDLRPVQRSVVQDAIHAMLKRSIISQHLLYGTEPSGFVGLVNKPSASVFERWYGLGRGQGKTAALHDAAEAYYAAGPRMGVLAGGGGGGSVVLERQHTPLACNHVSVCTRTYTLGDVVEVRAYGSRDWIPAPFRVIDGPSGDLYTVQPFVKEVAGMSFSGQVAVLAENLRPFSGLLPERYAFTGGPVEQPAKEHTPHPDCPECRGTGVYVGLGFNGAERCRTCGGAR